MIYKYTAYNIINIHILHITLVNMADTFFTAAEHGQLEVFGS